MHTGGNAGALTELVLMWPLSCDNTKQPISSTFCPPFLVPSAAYAINTPPNTVASHHHRQPPLPQRRQSRSFVACLCPLILHLGGKGGNYDKVRWWRQHDNDDEWWQLWRYCHCHRQGGWRQQWLCPPLGTTINRQQEEPNDEMGMKASSNDHQCRRRGTQQWRQYWNELLIFANFGIMSRLINCHPCTSS